MIKAGKQQKGYQKQIAKHKHQSVDRSWNRKLDSQELENASMREKIVSMNHCVSPATVGGRKEGKDKLQNNEMEKETKREEEREGKNQKWKKLSEDCFLLCRIPQELLSWLRRIHSTTVFLLHPLSHHTSTETQLSIPMSPKDLPMAAEDEAWQVILKGVMHTLKSEFKSKKIQSSERRIENYSVRKRICSFHYLTSWEWNNFLPNWTSKLTVLSVYFLVNH